jgi:hypothetical protein
MTKNTYPSTRVSNDNHKNLLHADDNQRIRDSFHHGRLLFIFRYLSAKLTLKIFQAKTNLPTKDIPKCMGRDFFLHYYRYPNFMRAIIDSRQRRAFGVHDQPCILLVVSHCQQKIISDAHLFTVKCSWHHGSRCTATSRHCGGLYCCN